MYGLGVLVMKFILLVEVKEWYLVVSGFFGRFLVVDSRYWKCNALWLVVVVEYR